MENTEELLTAKKVADKIGVSEAKVKKVIKDNEIAADATKGKCMLYNNATADKIKSLL